jgi:hypothetical protein
MRRTVPLLLISLLVGGYFTYNLYSSDAGTGRNGSATPVAAVSKVDRNEATDGTDVVPNRRNEYSSRSHRGLADVSTVLDYPETEEEVARLGIEAAEFFPSTDFADDILEAEESLQYDLQAEVERLEYEHSDHFVGLDESGDLQESFQDENGDIERARLELEERLELEAEIENEMLDLEHQANDAAWVMDPIAEMSDDTVLGEAALEEQRLLLEAAIAQESADLDRAE